DMQIRHRRATPADLANAGEIIARDRTLFSPQVWQELPALLEDLLARERILLCPMFDVETGHMAGMGASGFLDPEFLQIALASDGGFTDFMFAAELAGRAAFLSRRQVAAANSAAHPR